MNNIDEKKRTRNILSSFADNKELISNLGRDELNDLMKFCCIVLSEPYTIADKTKAINILYHVAFLDIISLEEAWQIYWIITSETFSNYKILLKDGNLLTLYKHIYQFVSSVVTCDQPYRNWDTRNKDCIVILVSQFLSERHAPTLRALDYSYTLQKIINKRVILINTGEQNFYRSQYLEPSFQFNFVPGYSNYTKINYKDITIDFYQVDSKMPNINIMQDIVDYIYEINPLFVYNIGASSIVTDLCTRFTTTVSLPCLTAIPISCSKYLLLGRKLETADEERLRTLEDDQHVIETSFNYIIRQSDKIYTREQFGIQKDVFLISIVGNRLGKEITTEFMQLLEDVTTDDDIEVAFVGKIDNKEILDKIDKNRRFHFTGQLQDASEFIKISNLNLNPKRKGGGRAGFEALHYGVPVLTLEYGDVYNVVGIDFAVKNYTEMATTIMKYYNDKEYFEEMKKKALLRAKELSDIEGNLRKVVNTIMELETKSNDTEGSI